HYLVSNIPCPPINFPTSFSLTDDCQPHHLKSLPTRRSSDLTIKRKLKYDFSPIISKRIRRITQNKCAITGDDDIHLDHFIPMSRSEEHTSELQSRFDLVCRLLLEKKY